MKIVNELDRRPPMVVIQVRHCRSDAATTTSSSASSGACRTRCCSIAASLAARASTGSEHSRATTTARPRWPRAKTSRGRPSPISPWGGLTTRSASAAWSFRPATNRSTCCCGRSRRRAGLRSSAARRCKRSTISWPTSTSALWCRESRAARISQVGTFNPTVEDISVGIILEVTPRTSPDGTIVMQINATKSSVGPDETGIPVFTDRQRQRDPLAANSADHRPDDGFGPAAGRRSFSAA